MGLRGRFIWVFLTLLMGAVLWMCNTGRVYLYGLPRHVLESLAQGAGLVPASRQVDLSMLLSNLPMDPIRSVSLFCVGATLLSFAILWLSLYRIWQNPASATLASGFLFFGSRTLWLAADTPEDCLGVAFIALGVACLVAGKVPLLLGPVLGAAYCEPASGVALYLALTYLAYKRHQAYGLPVSVCSVLGGGLLLALFCADYTLVPSLAGMGAWSLLPLLGLALNSELRASRAGLYLTLLAAALITGSAELASAIFLGDLALIALRIPARKETLSPITQGGWRVPVHRVFHVVALLVLGIAVLPGEQYLNRQILIPSQENDVAFSTLMVPFSLELHARRLGLDEWRAQTPFPGMTVKEVELVKSLQGPFRVLTAGGPSENRTLALVYTLVSGQPLTGWDDPDQLSASSLLCKALKSNVVVGDETVLLRDEDSSHLIPGPTLPEDLSGVPEVDFRHLINIPFRLQPVSEKPGTGFYLAAGQSKETLFFREVPAQIAFSSYPRKYLLVSLADSSNKRELEISRLRLELVATDLKEVLPSRSLIPLSFMLYNRGYSPISTAELESLTLGMQQEQPVLPPAQPFPKSFVLFPEEGIPLELFLATPEEEGRYQLAASFKTIDGQSRDLSIGGEKSLTTWRRLPPVGTWIEQP